MPRIGPVLAAMMALGVASTIFFLRQNSGAQIGGEISLPKILWLNYAIAAWFILPAFFSGYPLSRPLRRLFSIHLINFSIRAVIELYLLYVTVSWSPLYGIAHDVFSIALITFLASAPAQTAADQIALRFTWSVRLALCCEIAFAALFHRLTSAEHAIYFASDDARFRVINVLTSIVVAIAYADLLWVISRIRGNRWNESAAHA